MNTGKKESLPYSLSRWTDVPASKWSWMKSAIKNQAMLAFDPRTAVPSRWSLAPQDTLGLIFWTKNPTNLIDDAPWLTEYRYKVHVTVTGWHEVEKGAPDLLEGTKLLLKATEKFSPGNVSWRFSPVPAVPDVVERFKSILRDAASGGVKEVFLSFLQDNDLMREPRSAQERIHVIKTLGEVGARYGVRVLLCNEDRLLAGRTDLGEFLASGVCARPEDFQLASRECPPSEGCGCVLMVDPFTINESCTMGCQYCYAGDKSLSEKKRNTTLLRVLP